MQIVLITATGSILYQVSSLEGANQHPAWASPGGEQIAFENVSYTPLTLSNIFTVPVSGGSGQQITDNPAGEGTVRSIAWGGGTCPEGTVRDPEMEVCVPQEDDITVDVLLEDLATSDPIPINDVPPGRSFYMSVQVTNNDPINTVTVNYLDIGKWVTPNAPLEVDPARNRLSYPLAIIDQGSPFYSFDETAANLPGHVIWSNLGITLPAGNTIVLQGKILGFPQQAGHIEIGGLVEYVSGGVSQQMFYTKTLTVKLTNLDLSIGGTEEKLRAIMFWALWHETKDGNFFGGIDDFPDDISGNPYQPVNATLHAAQQKASELATISFPNYPQVSCTRSYEPDASTWDSMNPEPRPWLRFVVCDNPYYLAARTMINGILLYERLGQSPLAYFATYRVEKEDEENETVPLTDPTVSYWQESCHDTVYSKQTTDEAKILWFYNELMCRIDPSMGSYWDEFHTAYNRIWPQIDNAIEDVSESCTSYTDHEDYRVRCDPTDGASNLLATPPVYVPSAVGTNLVTNPETQPSCSPLLPLPTIAEIPSLEIGEGPGQIPPHISYLTGDMWPECANHYLYLLLIHRTINGRPFLVPAIGPYIPGGPSVIHLVIALDSVNSFSWPGWAHTRNSSQTPFQQGNYDASNYYYGSQIIPLYYTDYEYTR